MHPTAIVTDALVPPPGAAFVTVIESVPGVASIAAGTVAVSDVGLLAVRLTVAPFTWTTDALMKPVPVSVIEVAGESA